MAHVNIGGAPALPTPQQPGLRSFIVYDALPAGHAAYPVMDNRNEPHLHVGDIVVVDTSDTSPSDGELFLIAWKSSPDRPCIRETFIKSKIPGWCVGTIAQPAFMHAVAAERGEPVGRWCDWPLSTDYLQEIILGRIIGLLAPKYEEPRRITGPSHAGGLA